MSKPKIIIADRDYDYLLPLQIKFAEEFFDSIELELINDMSCFGEFFSKPQSADVLIVSQDLMDSGIQRQQIDSIFVMTEQQDAGAPDETEMLNTFRMFKYSNASDIFNKVVHTNRSLNALVNKTDQSEPQMIVVYSANGGAGKTTVAAGVAAALARNYKRVLYMNAARMSSFQSILEDPSPLSSSDAVAKLTRAGDTIYGELAGYIRKEKFSYLPPLKNALLSLDLDYSVFRKLAVSAKRSGDFDYVIVDADTVFDESKAELLDVADKVVIVANRTAASVNATNMLTGSINGVNSGEKYIFVCNNCPPNLQTVSKVPEKYTFSVFVPPIDNCDDKKPAEIANEAQIQQIAMLLI